MASYVLDCGKTFCCVTTRCFATVQLDIMLPIDVEVRLGWLARTLQKLCLIVSLIDRLSYTVEQL